MEPEDSLSMGDEHLITIPEKESDEFIKSSVEEPLFKYKRKSVTFSNPLFDLNEDFTSSDDESLSDEDVSEDNVKIYSNPLFEFDDEYISSDVNPFFNEVKSEIDEIDAFLDMDISTDFEDDYYDSEGDIIYLESLLIKDTIPNLYPEVFLDHNLRNLKDEPDNLKSMVKVFNPGIWEKNFSPTYVKLSFEDRHYLSITYVIRFYLLSISTIRTDGISLEWNFHVLQCLSKHLEWKSDGDLLFHIASSLTLAEQEAANIMQTLKESKKTSRRQPGTRGSNEGTGSEPGVPDESTVGSTTPSEGTGVKPGVPDEDKDITEEKMDEKDGDTDDEGDDRVSSDKGDEEIIDAAKEEAEKTSEAKDDTKKIELPPSSSSLSVSSGFGDQFLKISSDSSLVSTVKDSADADVSSLLDIPIQHETPRSSLHQCRRFSYHTPIISTIQQTTTPIPTPKITTNAPTITIVVPKSNALTAVELRVAKLEKYVFELKTGDHSSVALAVLQSYVPTVVDSYLDTKVRDVFQKELQKHTAYPIHKYSLQHLHELTKKPTPTTEPEFEKSPSEILKIKRE
ncbi:hypothetical protein Tco_0033956 [Tanacetum coccineum]